MESGGIDIDDYEGLPENLPATTHMIAGATAGITEHCLIYPVDCIKTRMQAINPSKQAKYSGIVQAMRTIVAKEGFGRTFHGMPAVIAGAGPAHAMYFACYEKIKWMLSEKKQSSVYATIVAGGCATLFHDGLMVPADVIKQRMQMYNSPYKSSLDCARSVVKHEGVRALYRSYTTQLAMNIPFQIVHFSIYEQAQNLLNFEREYNPVSHIVSGGAAGAAAALITNPLDVCKTLLNTQEICCSSGRPVDRGMRQAFRTVVACRGYAGFFRGAKARMVFQMPGAAISWSVYEFFKFILGNQHSPSGKDGDNDGYDTISSQTPQRKSSLIPPVYANDNTRT